MDEEQHWHCRLSKLRGSHSLAEHVQLHLTLLRPVLVAPNLVFFWIRRALRCSGECII